MNSNLSVFWTLVVLAGGVLLAIGLLTLMFTFVLPLLFGSGGG